MQVRWLVPFGSVAALLAPTAYATQYLSVEQAQHAAFPQATEFRGVDVPPNIAATLGAPAGWAPRIVEARNGDTALGWLIADQVIGKSELIGYALALDAGGAVVSLEVLDYRESHGGEVRLAPWRRQFVGKAAADPAALSKDIKNISGATLSCRHLVEGVQRLLKLYNVALRPGRT